jgi:hypothetical protein
VSWKVYPTEQVINGESCALWQGKRPCRGLHELPTAMEKAMPQKFMVSAGGGAGLRLERREQTLMRYCLGRLSSLHH